MNTAWRLALAIALCLIACRRSSPGGLPERTGSELEAADGGQVSLTLTQTSLLPGTTAVDPSAARVLLRTLNVSTKDTIVELLTQNATFTSDDGETISVTPRLDIVKMPPEGVIVSVTPTTSLKPDHWYTFGVAEDASLQMTNGKAPADLAARTTSVWKSDFFTGSAPHIVGVQAPTGTKDGAYVHVVWSEPISLAQIAIPSLMTVDGSSIAKCIAMGGVCAPSLAGAVAQEFDIIPTRPLGAFSQILVSVPATLPGAARTASDALAVAGTRVASSALSGGMVRTTLAQASWHSCENGALRCWQAHNQ